MAEIGSDVFFLSIAEIGAKLKAGEFSCEELTKAFCARLESIGPRYNALALALTEDAVKQAKNVDGDLKRRRARGPLQGIPYGAKDLLSVAGRKTTWGAKPYASQQFEIDATVVKKLRGSGAVLCGKLAMVELAGGGGYRYASASLTGPGLNPWSLERWAGGSSSGSGAGVAAGLVPFAIGSETWGSILTPAAFCGVTGLRPTYGLVSRYGAMALSWTMDKVGPLCRTAEDCGLVLQAISGGDSNDPGSAGKGFYYTPQFVRKMADLTIGHHSADVEAWAEEATRPAFRKAMDVVREIGTKLKAVELPDFPYRAVAGTVISAEGSAIFEPLVASGEVDQLADKRQIAGLRAGLEIPAKDYLKAMRIRAMIQRELRVLMRDVDVLVSPARFSIANPVAEPLDRGRGESSPKVRGLSDLSAAGNLAGLPALILPCGFSEGMPVALQLVGRPFTENTLIAIGKEFQARTDWHRKRPPGV